MIKPDNFFVTHGWMRTELNLSGTELSLYAILYGFSQDGESQYSGSIPYLSEWLGVSRVTIHNSINSLMKKGLVKRHKDTPDHSCYQAFRCPQNLQVDGQSSGDGVLKNLTGDVKNLNRGCKNSKQGVLKNLTGGVKNLNTDNIEDTIEKKIVDTIERGGKAPKAPPSYEEVVEYIREHHPGVSPEKFYSYYEARGWHLGGGQKVKNWKALARNWASREGDYNRKKSAAYTTGLVPSRPLTPEEQAKRDAASLENQRQLKALLAAVGGGE